MLEIKNLSFEVDNGEAKTGIVKDVSFTVPEGKFVVITGPNGGGKSTIARLIMGIEKPTFGKIFFNGEDITDLSVTDRAKKGIGYAFQQPPRFKGMTVRRLLSLASGQELPEDVCNNCLTSVGLCSREYLNREVDASLSGGEVKRIEIATLISRKLGLAIFDEPEAGIDLWSFAKLVETFQEIIRTSCKSVILISHQERIMQLADEIIVVAEGKIRTRGTKDEVFPSLMGEVASRCCKL